MDFLLDVLLLLVTLVAILVIRRWAFGEEARRLAPGPWGVPIFGCLPLLRRGAPFATLHRWSLRYGPIYRLRLGSVPVVVLADPALIRTAFKEEAFCGKPPLYVTHGIMKGYGLIAAEGPLWKEQRKFTVSCLRDFGMTKSKLSRKKLEEQIVQEVNVFITTISRWGSQPFDIHSILLKMAGNLTSSVVLGTRFEDDHEDFQRQLDNSDKGSEVVEIAGVLNFLPFLRFLPNFRRFLGRVLGMMADHHEFLKKVIFQHRLYLSESEIVRDFIDAYLLEMRQKELHAVPSYFSETQLLHLLADLFGAGVETTKVTMKWGFLHLMLHPEVQTKAQEELDRVIGRNRNPCLDDLPLCPYTEAVILELQRLSNVVPLGAPHGTTQDAMLAGYFIPKGTMILPLLWTVHMDPTNWLEPEKFQPERFLGENNRTRRPDCFMPFSVGRRTCVGEELARMSLFLTLSTVLHRFTLKWPIEDGTGPDLTPISGFTISPRPYRVCAIARD